MTLIHKIQVMFSKLYISTIKNISNTIHASKKDGQYTYMLLSYKVTTVGRHGITKVNGSSLKPVLQF